jgi:predicted Zn-dependent protease
MAKIELWDGTRDPKYARQLMPVLGELSTLQGVRIDRTPGKEDIPRWNYINEIANHCFDGGRGQINLSRFLDILPATEVCSEPSSQKLILLEDDLFSPGLNWCFGVYSPREEQDLVVLSTYRIQNGHQMQDLLAHELGHMYGAAKSGRRNTEESLGSHCLTDLCVMQQKLSVPASLRYSQRRHESGASFYCGQCSDEIRR